MSITGGIFSDKSDFHQRFVEDYDQLAELVRGFKASRLKVGLVMGSFDIFHIGHAEYLASAKSLCDVLIVGVDSDEKIRERKTKHDGLPRPAVPQEERMQILSHVRAVDVITIKHLGDPKWHLIKTVRPDVLQAVIETYTDEQREELKEFCGQVIVQNRFAITSTTERLRQILLKGGERLAEEVIKRMPKVLEESMAAVRHPKGVEPSTE